MYQLPALLSINRTVDYFNLFFIYALLNDAVINSGEITSNDITINAMETTWKKIGRGLI